MKITKSKVIVASGILMAVSIGTYAMQPEPKKIENKPAVVETVEPVVEQEVVQEPVVETPTPVVAPKPVPKVVTPPTVEETPQEIIARQVNRQGSHQAVKNTMIHCLNLAIPALMQQVNDSTSFEQVVGRSIAFASTNIYALPLYRENDCHTYYMEQVRLLVSETP